MTSFGDVSKRFLGYCIGWSAVLLTLYGLAMWAVVSHGVTAVNLVCLVITTLLAVVGVSSMYMGSKVEKAICEARVKATLNALGGE